MKMMRVERMSRLGRPTVRLATTRLWPRLVGARIRIRKPIDPFFTFKN